MVRLTPILLQLVTFLFLAVIAAHAHSQTHQPDGMLDSGHPAEGLYPTRWIDNTRVLFTAVKLGTYPCDHTNTSHCGPHGHLLAVSIWDTRKNQITTYLDRILTDLCVHKGFISYKARLEPAHREGSVLAGNFGNEKVLGLISEYRYMNPNNCRYYRDAPRPFAEKRRARLLLDEHGYVDFGPLPRTPDEFSPPVLRSLDGKKAINLDIEARYLQNRYLSFSYLPFANEYFARADVIDSSALAPALYLNPAGTVRTVEFASRRKLGGNYYGVKRGVFLSTDGDTLDGRNGGGYLLESGNLVQVVSGALRSVSVSPDGCKVAFIYSPSARAIGLGYSEWRKGKPANTVRMINLCDGVRQ